LTSNKSFGKLGELMGDPILATAILDRLLHHSHIVNIRGNRYRLREKMKIGAYGFPLDHLTNKKSPGGSVLNRRGWGKIKSA
jgi:hypothetical protein